MSYNQSLSGQDTGSVTEIGPATATPGYRLKVGAINLFNNNAAVGWLQIFFIPKASVTLGTTVPTLSIPLIASGELTWSFGDKGWILGSTGLCFAATTTRTGSTGASIAWNIAAE